MADDFIGNDSLGASVTPNVAVADSSVINSPATEQSVAVIGEPQPTERYRFGYEFKNNKFNEDQDYYNKEYGHLLVLKVKPPPPPEVEAIDEPTAESDTTEVKKKGFMSKFRNKKGKKKDEVVDEEEEPKEDGFN